MKQGMAQHARQHVPVIGDVEDVGNNDVENAREDEIDWNPKTIDLGDGYVEINGYVFHENWDEIDPPGSDDEPGIPHEEVMAYLDAQLRERQARR